jgi:hypothetical protein
MQPSEHMSLRGLFPAIQQETLKPMIEQGRVSHVLARCAPAVLLERSVGWIAAIECRDASVGRLIEGDSPEMDLDRTPIAPGAILERT